MTTQSNDSQTFYSRAHDGREINRGVTDDSHLGANPEEGDNNVFFHSWVASHTEMYWRPLQVIGQGSQLPHLPQAGTYSLGQETGWLS